MLVESHEISVDTQGNNHVIDITSKILGAVRDGRARQGTVTVFVVGSTAGITTTEFEPGLVNHDLKAAFEGIAPEHGRYVHEETWHDDNGHSHVRASLLGPSLTIPLIDGELPLGTWQQIILIDFDTRPRSRRIVIQIMGE
ncbi:MAG: secondary thiamine-phosphate synthase enzyme YjbQ [Planctomycetota bacterium]|jgi:secondary thiamine-phosphate synthase enzyme